MIVSVLTLLGLFWILVLVPPLCVLCPSVLLSSPQQPTHHHSGSLSVQCGVIWCGENNVVTGWDSIQMCQQVYIARVSYLLFSYLLPQTHNLHVSLSLKDTSTPSQTLSISFSHSFSLSFSLSHTHTLSLSLSLSLISQKINQTCLTYCSLTISVIVQLIEYGGC